MTNQNNAAQAAQDLAHEIWAAAQTPPDDTIDAAVARIVAVLSRLRAPVADAQPVEPENTAVICPSCAHQFRAIPVQVQDLLRGAGYKAPFLGAPAVADERQAVAYLDLGAGGYTDVGTDLTDEQLATLPKGRHMLAIIGTHGADGYTPAALASAPSAGQQPIVHQHGFAADNQRLRAINESLDKQLEEVMTERDNREDVIDKLLDIVLGADRSEWSSEYGYGHAVIEVEERMHALASAPVADERAALEWYAEHVAGCRKLGPDGDAARQALDKDGGERARAALASAPVTEDDEVERIRGLGPAYPYTPNTAPPTPLAIAPVAGEAKNYPGENVAERLDNMADDQPPGSQAQSDLYAAATIWRKHIAHRAAPQASTVAREAQPSRQTLLDAIWRHGNARAMAEHNIACRDEVRNTADALLALFDAAPQASAEPVGWFDTSTSSGMIRWRPGLTASSFPEGHPFYAGPVAPQPTEEGGDNG